MSAANHSIHEPTSDATKDHFVWIGGECCGSLLFGHAVVDA
jgi:hypothetical protein